MTYLAEHPDAEDSLEAITEWWLLERAIRRGLVEVEGALQELVAEGWVEERPGREGGVRYRVVPERRADLTRRLAGRVNGRESER